jgi:molybdopterin biosynthesis enzyme
MPGWKKAASTCPLAWSAAPIAAGPARMWRLARLALPAGTRLGPAEIGLAAALGFAELPVHRRPRIGVFSTGDELAAPGAPLGAAQTYDSNRFSLLALLAGLPVDAVDLGILPDRAGITEAALRDAAAGHDMLLTSGGVSPGRKTMCAPPSNPAAAWCSGSWR